MKNTHSKPCLTCGAETNNPKFCSRSCNVTYNNTVSPKRSRKRWYCPRCDEGKRKSQAKGFDGCVSCWIELEDKRLGEMTLEEAINLEGHPKSRYNTVRHHGRKLRNEYSMCQICSYDIIVQVCHIRPVSSFPLDTKISEINDLSNIAFLCPNHHLELDRGFISAQDIPARI